MSLNYWLADGPRLGDGFVRYRLKVGGKVDLCLLARASVDPGHAEGLNGYGLCLEGDKLSWVRWDHGVVLPMGPEVSAPGLSRPGELEVALWLTGPQLAGMVYDASSLSLLGAVAAQDNAWPQGAVGLRIHPTKGGDAAVEAISVLEAGTPPAKGEAKTPFGDERIVPVTAEELAGAPIGVFGPVVTVPAEGGGQAIKTDRLGAERLRRAGVKGEASGDMSWIQRETARAGKALAVDYLDADAVEARLRDLQAKHPDIARVVEIGRSRQGRPILAMHISDNPDRDEDEPAVLLNGAHHGSELLSTDYVMDAIDVLLGEGPVEPRAARWVAELDIWCVPLVNPDGNMIYLHRTHWHGRKNAADDNRDGVIDGFEGVDLNRNYPFKWGALGEDGSRSFQRHNMYRGPSPGSEPEVQAMMKLAEQRRFVASVSYHTNATAILSPYTIDNVKNPEPDVAWQVAEALAATLPVQPNKKRYVVKRKIYSVDGVDQDWYFFRYGTLAYLVEGSHYNPLDPAVRAASIAGVRGFFEGLLDRVLAGPMVWGHTVDVNGKPVEAQVEIVEIKRFENEVWTSRPRDGRFDRVLPGAGTYTVRATSQYYRESEVTVTVKEGERVEVKVEMLPRPL